MRAEYRTRAARYAGLAALAICLATSPSRAATETQPRQVAPLTPYVRAELAAIQKLLEGARYAQALFELVPVYFDSINAHDYAQVHSMIAYARLKLGDRRLALDHYRRVLDDEHRIPQRLLTSTLYTLAQLSFAQGDPAAALGYADRWRAFGQTASPEALAFIGRIHYALGGYTQAIEHIEAAVAERAKPGNVPEDWWRLLSYLYQEQGDWERLVAVLERLNSEYPDANYEHQLAAARARRAAGVRGETRPGAAGAHESADAGRFPAGQSTLAVA